MNAVDEIMSAANAFNLRLKKCVDQGAPSFQDLAACLCGAVFLRTTAATVALRLPAGKDRDFVLAVRTKAIEGEKKLRRGLGISPPVLGAGRC